MNINKICLFSLFSLVLCCCFVDSSSKRQEEGFLSSSIVSTDESLVTNKLIIGEDEFVFNDSKRNEYKYDAFVKEKIIEKSNVNGLSRSGTPTSYISFNCDNAFSVTSIQSYYDYQDEWFHQNNNCTNTLPNQSNSKQTKYFVNNPLSNPYDSLAYLNLTFRRTDGTNTIEDYFMGTSFLVAPGVLLTAAHCVYSNGDFGGSDITQGFASHIFVNPKRNGSEIVSERFEITKCVIPYEWYVNKNWSYDWALLYFEDSINSGLTSYRYLSEYNDNTITSNSVNVIGNQIGDNGLMSVTTCGNISKPNAHSLRYSANTASGNSGSPVFSLINNKLYIIGIHSNRTKNLFVNYSECVRLRNVMFYLASTL
ncbi:MAG: trypsin-like peptidase domain-containing protein [Bacilli bacterium]